MKSKKYVIFSLVVVLCLLVLPGLTASAHNLPQWKQANPVPPNEPISNISALAVFNGYLYTGTTYWSSLVSNVTAIYRSKDGRTWQKVSLDGFGTGNNNVIDNLEVFRDQLYVATGGWNPGDVAQLWRSSNGTDWKPVETTVLAIRITTCCII